MNDQVLAGDFGHQDGAVSAAEWRLRVELAGCYRIFDYLGWTELIFNHISLRLPGPEHHFLINPYGLWYREVTASKLMKIDLDGNVIAGQHGVNKAGFVIHSAVHAARPDALCVMHTHTTSTMAVACQRQGLRCDNFYSAFLAGEIAYHDFEGVTVNQDERQRLVASLGDKHLMLLRNHGPLTVGRSVEEAFLRLWTLQRACDVQLATDSGGAATVPISAAAAAASRANRDGNNSAMDHRPTDRLVYDALLREIDRIDPSYKT